MSEEPRVLKCMQCGVILGVIRRGADRRSKLDVLRRHAFPPKSGAVQRVSDDRAAYAVIGLEHGTLLCGHCGAERTWHMSEQALDDLFANRKKRTFGLEVA